MWALRPTGWCGYPKTRKGVGRGSGTCGPAAFGCVLGPGLQQNREVCELAAFVHAPGSEKRERAGPAILSPNLRQLSLLRFLGSQSTQMLGENQSFRAHSWRQRTIASCAWLRNSHAATAQHSHLGESVDPDERTVIYKRHAGLQKALAIPRH